MWPNLAPLREIRLRNLYDLDFDLQGRSRSNVTVPLASICGFLLMFISYMWPNMAAVRDICLHNMSDLELNPS